MLHGGDVSRNCLALGMSAATARTTQSSTAIFSSVTSERPYASPSISLSCWAVATEIDAFALPPPSGAPDRAEDWNHLGRSGSKSSAV